jgi:hypothetical protein
MLPKLRKDSKFLQEVKTLRDEVKKVKNESLKIECRKLTDKLVDLADIIDVGHTANPNGHINPGLLQDTRTQMSIIRQTVRRKLDDYNKG